MGAKMDRTMSRTVADIERKYDLGRGNSASGSSANIELLINQINQKLSQYDENFNTIIEELTTDAADIWVYSGIPTLENAPAVNWTDEEKAKHIGDFYYDKDNSILYAFKINNGAYEWEKCLSGDVKSEQEKTVTITENGTTEVIPDDNKTLSKVTVVAAVEGGTEEIEDLIDNSGVLEDTEGTVSEKVEQLIEKGDRYKYLKDNATQISFQGNGNIKTLTLDCSNMVCLQWLVSGCKSLNSVYLTNTQNVNNWTQAFFRSEGLYTIETLDFSSATGINSQVWNNWLQNLKVVPETIKCNFAITMNTLTAESIQSIIDGLATVTTAQTLTLHKNIVLTDEQKATINAKGWTLAQ
jgi:hypothetical protein